MNMDEWDHKDLWRKRGAAFLIEVSRHLVGTDYKGPNRWCVYAYIYPDHPEFKNFSGTNLFQQAAVEMPLHGYPSLITWHYDADGEVTSVQVGADYDHLHDDDFCNAESVEDAEEVFQDAQALFDYLDKMTEVSRET